MRKLWLLPDVGSLSQSVELQRREPEQARAALERLYTALRGTDKTLRLPVAKRLKRALSRR